MSGPKSRSKTVWAWDKRTSARKYLARGPKRCFCIAELIIVRPRRTVNKGKKHVKTAVLGHSILKPTSGLPEKTRWVSQNNFSRFVIGVEGFFDLTHEILSNLKMLLLCAWCLLDWKFQKTSPTLARRVPNGFGTLPAQFRTQKSAKLRDRWQNPFFETCRCFLLFFRSKLNFIDFDCCLANESQIVRFWKSRSLSKTAKWCL